MQNKFSSSKIRMSITFLIFKNSNNQSQVQTTYRVLYHWCPWKIPAVHWSCPLLHLPHHQAETNTNMIFGGDDVYRISFLSAMQLVLRLDDIIGFKQRKLDSSTLYVVGLLQLLLKRPGTKSHLNIIINVVYYAVMVGWIYNYLAVIKTRLRLDIGKYVKHKYVKWFILVQ